jgi:hypothetical protein
VFNLTGRRLKFDAGDPEQGVFFIADDGTAHQVEMMLKNLPTESIFIIPTLPAGNYTLEVPAILPGNTQLRSGKP